MKKSAWILFGAGVVIGTILLVIRPYTGYMDADYYYAGAKSIFEGKGWLDYAIWNYLAQPDRIPFPAFTYWMPAASLVAALGMYLSGNSTLHSARIPFVLLFASIAPITYLLSVRIFNNKKWALLSAILVLAGGYYLKFVTEPDGFVILFLCGLGMLFWITHESLRGRWYGALLLGGISGAIHLTRADGLVWLFLLVGLLLTSDIFQAKKKPYRIVFDLLLFLAGYFVIMGAWYTRNWLAFGSLMPPGTSRGLWFTTYDQLFTYPADLLTRESWLGAGWAAILSARWKALLLNLSSVIAVNGMIILIPGIIAGWLAFHQRTVKWFFAIAFCTIFALMTFVFPLAGMRGGLLHSLAIFQPFLWILAPMGLSILWTRWKLADGRFALGENQILFGIGILAVVISAYVIRSDRLADTVNQSDLWQEYLRAESFLDDKSAGNDGPVLVNNPPAYYASTGRSALMIPYGNETTILDLARQFSASHLLLDGSHISQLDDLYLNPTTPRNGFRYIGELDGIQLFELNPAEAIP